MGETKMAARRDEPVTASGARILIVEDEAIIALGIERQLKQMGYAVVGLAGSGEDGLRLALAHRPDLVLMDIQLGHGIDGVQAADAIRQSVGVPVVYLTAHSDSATLQRAKLAEPFGYVLKPYEERDLQTAIEIALYRHRMEQRLRENEEWLAATLASIGDAVIATDELGRIRFLNSLAERLTGWRHHEALGRPHAEIFRIVEGTTREPIPSPVDEALATGRNATLAENAVLLAADGAEYPVDDSAAPIRDVNGAVAGAVLVFRDVTERRRLEESLRQAQKIEAIGRLAGGIAHDFNNILTVIVGTGELLGQRLGGDPDGAELLYQMVSAAQRASVMTQQIMAFGRKQLLQPRVLDLNGTVHDLAGMVRRLMGPHVEVVIDVAADLGRTRADATQVGQILLNLAANARDAMETSPVHRLTIATANVELDASVTRLYPDVPAGRYVRLSVTDTGVGIPANRLGGVFEPFFSTKAIGEGAGLGLASVHGIVKQSGGHIEVTSVVGQGSTFHVYLPRVDEPQPAAPRPPARGGLETILLVDDEASLRLLTRKVLEQRGYRVLEAADGAAALEVCAGLERPIDLLITDLTMPGQSGRALAEQMRAGQPGLRILFMSGYADPAAVPLAASAAGTGFLAKPFTPTSLAAKVRAILDGGPTSTAPDRRP
jgi:PAS domain S-box-containing protein